ncbi:MAG: two-component sensor histidine kinase [Clostridiaceae bacterium]|nr:two-component sensor histidine kinase [Clostridiaceae bacterium]
MSIQLEKQKEELIEKQDYELNIATLNERKRIAREIHDNVGHLLSSAILQSGALITTVKDENIKKHILSLKDTLTKAMNSIRASVHNLHEESVDLKVQIEELINNFTFCNISLEYSVYDNPEKKIKYCFISIIKEALANIIKHSNATDASIIIREHPALYQLIIRDNGDVKGYNSEEGLGIKNMIDRVNSLKGNINIMTQNGFEIFIAVPRKEAI